MVHEEELFEINVQILWDGRTASEIFGWHLVSRIEILDLGYSNIYKAFYFFFFFYQMSIIVSTDC